MNNILVDDTLIFDKDYDNYFELEELDREVECVIREDKKVKLTIISINSKIDLDITLEKNSKLFLQIITFNGSVNLNTKLNSRSEFKLNNSIVNKESSNNKIVITHLEDNSISEIKNHGYSINGCELVFDIEGTILKEANKCIHHQDNQIIENKNSFSSILPKLYIDNYDVDATHSAYVGEFKEEELFYLESRGISLNNSKKLLLNAFILGYLQINDVYRSRLNDMLYKEVK